MTGKKEVTEQSSRRRTKNRDKTSIGDKNNYHPPDFDTDFKGLFFYATANGIGRTDGKSWTPEALTEAINSKMPTSSSIDLRTIQFWFQESNNGISNANIDWLSRVFSGGNNEMARLWRVKLFEAKKKTSQSRKAKTNEKDITAEVIRDTPNTGVTSGTSSNTDSISQNNNSTSFFPAQREGRRSKFVLSNTRTIAELSEKAFHSSNILMLPSFIWVVGYLLLFLTIIGGVHHLTYSLSGDVQKQIGFIWSLSWTLNPGIMIPSYIMIIHKMLSYWKYRARHGICRNFDKQQSLNEWYEQVHNYRHVLRIVFFTAWGIVFFIQWYGIHYINLVNSGSSNLLIDWYFASLVRPDVISLNQMLLISFVGWWYMGMIFWFVLLGLAFAYLIIFDFCNLVDTKTNADADELLEAANRLVRMLVISTIFCILIATIMKAQAAFIISYNSNILNWLVDDFQKAFDMGFRSRTVMSNHAIPYVTSFALCSLGAFIFFYSLIQVRSTLTDALKSRDGYLVSFLFRPVISISIVLINYLTIGIITGFTIIFALTLAIVIFYILTGHKIFSSRQIKIE